MTTSKLDNTATATKCRDTLFYLETLRKVHCTQTLYVDYRNTHKNPPYFLSPFNDKKCNQVLMQMGETLNKCYPEQQAEFEEHVKAHNLRYGL
jgi:hypothetical protein